MGRNWNDEENRTLTELVNTHGKQWGIIASHMPNRTASQICAHWEKCINPALKKGPFTAAEDQSIFDHVKEHGPHDWPVLCQKLTQRSPKQCRERWFNHLDPGVRNMEWTLEEDYRIYESYKRFGPRWSHIAKFIPGRPDNAIKNRWNSSISKRIVPNNFGNEMLAPESGPTDKPAAAPQAARPPPIRAIQRPIAVPMQGMIPFPIRPMPPPPASVANGQVKEEGREAPNPSPLPFGNVMSPFFPTSGMATPFFGFSSGACTPFSGTAPGPNMFK
jgi:hypothetical protein